MNSEGKTNETTKKVDVPLKKGQSNPKETQSEKQQEKETKANSQSESPKKRKGRKV